jgi:hypothetical protein
VFSTLVLQLAGRHQGLKIMMKRQRNKMAMRSSDGLLGEDASQVRTPAMEQLIFFVSAMER